MTRRPAQHPHLRPVLVAVAVYLAAAMLWLAFGHALPGGRWLAVHLFTLGIVTNAIVGLTHHFAETLLHVPSRCWPAARFVLLNAGAVLMLASWPGARWTFAAGATAVTAAVMWLYADLRRMRKATLSGRFAFVVRAYERACGAFVHGALLGLLVGVGALSGSWYAAARLAHLHVNILGWAGLTLLATVVFFGPTILRTRMEEGADRTAAVALRWGTTALTLAVVALLLTGLDGGWSVAARLAAAACLGAFAVAAAAVCLPVIRVGARAKPSAQAWMIRAACVWFVAVVWADVAVVATGRWRLLDALGAAMVVGVLGQAILASLGYLAPMLAAGGPNARAAVRARLELLPRLRLVALNGGAVLVLTGLAAGWVLVAAAAAGQLLLVLSGLVSAGNGEEVASAG